jgi:phage terminase large subunit-like protein
MSTQSAKIEAGHVFLPVRAECLDDFRTELLQFPHGRYDDQIDIVSQFLNWIDQRQRCTVTIVPLEL